MILFDTKAELSSHTAWEHYSWVINVLDTGANSEGGMPIVEAISCCFFSPAHAHTLICLDQDNGFTPFPWLSFSRASIKIHSITDFPLCHTNRFQVQEGVPKGVLSLTKVIEWIEQSSEQKAAKQKKQSTETMGIVGV